jgi:hypothetical protein
LAPQPLPPCVTVAPTMPVRMVSAMIASLLLGADAHACPCAVDQAYAGATEARVVRRELGIIRCILNCLLSIVAGFLWCVEGGGGDTKKDDSADRMYVVWDFVDQSARGLRYIKLATKSICEQVQPSPWVPIFANTTHVYGIMPA